MNIFGKLAKARVEFQQRGVKMSGNNKFAGYKYYDLSDILPPINSIMSKLGLVGLVSFSADTATLTLVNAEEPEEQIMFTSPMVEVALKGTNAVQNLGAAETYQRRYLYLTAFEIVESDYFDAVQGKPAQSPQKSQKPAGQQTTQPQAEKPAQSPAAASDAIVCECCGKPILGQKVTGKSGKATEYTPQQIAASSLKKYGKRLCFDCAVAEMNKGGNNNA